MIIKTKNNILAKLWLRIKSDNGTLSLVMALVLFFGCGMCVCTWNSYVLSKEKMRLQAAADAAALEHALWQARAMNLIQDLNSEIYDACHVSQILYGMAGGIKILSNLAFISVVGISVGKAMKKIADGLDKVATYIKKVLVNFMIGLRTFYKYSPTLGYISAQRAAKFNGASPIIESISSIKIFGTAIDLSPYAIGLSASSMEMLRAPAEDTSGKEPLKLRFWVSVVYRAGYFSSVGWKEVKYLASDGNIKPTFWIVQGAYPPPGWISIFDDFLHIKTTKGFKLPVMAYACAKAYSGDLVSRSSNKNSFRPHLFGAGANAVLVPISQMCDESQSSTINKVKDILMLYH